MTDESSNNKRISNEARIHFLILTVLAVIALGVQSFTAIASVLATIDRSMMVEEMRELKKDYSQRFDVAAREYIRMTRAQDSLRDRLSAEHAEMLAILNKLNTPAPVVVPVPIPPPEPKPEEKKE